VLLTTVPPAPSSYESTLSGHNSNVRNGWQTIADGYVELRQGPLATTNTAYGSIYLDSDHLHYAAPGHIYMAGLFSSGINNLLSTLTNFTSVTVSNSVTAASVVQTAGLGICYLTNIAAIFTNVTTNMVANNRAIFTLKTGSSTVTSGSKWFDFVFGTPQPNTNYVANCSPILAGGSIATGAVWLNFYPSQFTPTNLTTSSVSFVNGTASTLPTSSASGNIIQIQITISQ